MSVGQDVRLDARFRSARAGPPNLGHADWLRSAPESRDRDKLAGRVRPAPRVRLSAGVVIDLQPDDQGKRCGEPVMRDLEYARTRDLWRGADSHVGSCERQPRLDGGTVARL